MNEVTTEQFNASFEKAWAQISRQTTQVTNPSVFVLGGLPGSGKSRLGALVSEKLDNNVVMINGDELRLYHPNAKALQAEYGASWVDKAQDYSGKMVETAIQQSIKEQKNAIVEGTFRTSKTPINTLSEYQKNGYQTHVAILAVDKDDAWDATLERLNKAEKGEQRATPKSHFNKVVEAIGHSADEVLLSGKADNFSVYTLDSLRQGKAVFDSNVDSKQPSEVINKILN